MLDTSCEKAAGLDVEKNADGGSEMIVGLCECWLWFGLNPGEGGSAPGSGLGGGWEFRSGRMKQALLKSCRRSNTSTGTDAKH